MFTKKLVLIVILLFLASGLIYLKIKKNGLSKISINNQELEVEIADTDSKKSKGLSGRKSLAENQGMLFIFTNPDYHQFWMLDMHFPLDFIWIKENTFVDITENVRPPDNASSLPPIFSSKIPFDKALEVNAGSLNAYNIKVGDNIKL